MSQLKDPMQAEACARKLRPNKAKLAYRDVAAMAHWQGGRGLEADPERWLFDDGSILYAAYDNARGIWYFHAYRERGLANGAR